MRGIGTFTTSLLLLAGSLAWSAGPDYFPLNVGNQWVYRTGGDSALQLEITRTGEFNGKTYFLLHGFPSKDYWLRTAENGSLVAFDPDTNQESVWYAFQAPEGQPFETSVPDNCCGRGVIASRTAKYKGPIGEFDYALDVRYTGITPQSAIVHDLFLPYVGMIHRTQATRLGTETYDLTYARLGGVTVISAPELAFSLSLDSSVYTANLMPPVDPQRSVPLMVARLTLRNTSQPIKLEFPSGQTYDLVIKNEKGDILFRWSDGKAFTTIFRTETFGPGEKNFVIPVRLGTPDGKPFPEGRYIVEAWLTTNGPRVFTASAPFELRQVF